MEEEVEYGVDYFIDVIEYENRFGVRRETAFKALSNFKLDLSFEVKNAGQLSGYACTVTLFDGKCLGYVCVIFWVVTMHVLRRIFTYIERDTFPTNGLKVDEDLGLSRYGSP